MQVASEDRLRRKGITGMESKWYDFIEDESK
jgi:hypothetical protein